MELAEALFVMERFGEARCGVGRFARSLCLNQFTFFRTFFIRAAELRSSTILGHIHSLERVSDCYIEDGDYHSALSTLTEIAEKAEQFGGKPPESVYADVLKRFVTLHFRFMSLAFEFNIISKRCEVVRVLLLLLIEPTSQNVSPSLTQILEKYAWESEEPEATLAEETYLSQELFLLLQSLVMSVQLRDGKATMELVRIYINIQ